VLFYIIILIENRVVSRLKKLKTFNCDKLTAMYNIVHALPIMDDESSGSEGGVECPSVKTFEARFIFDDKNNFNEVCEIVIKIEERVYTHEPTDPHWYYINYTYYFINNESNAKFQIADSYKHQANPFYKRENAADEFEGAIVFKNDMTEQMVKYLVMPFEELGKFTATTRPQDYKRQLIQSITTFW